VSQTEMSNCEWCESHYHTPHNEAHHGKQMYYKVSLRNQAEYLPINRFNRIILCGECLHDWMAHDEPIIFAYQIHPEIAMEGNN